MLGEKRVTTKVTIAVGAARKGICGMDMYVYVDVDVDV